MKLVTDNSKPQRRIIIENEPMIRLFDLLQEGIAKDPDSPPMPIEFWEVEDELSSLIEGVLAHIISKMMEAPMFNLIFDSKTFETLVEQELVSKSLERYVRKHEEEFSELIIGHLAVLLTEAIEDIINQLIKESVLGDLKKIKIKTRRHLIAFC